jgi:hypothetical protein
MIHPSCDQVIDGTLIHGKSSTAVCYCGQKVYLDGNISTAAQSPSRRTLSTMRLMASATSPGRS